MSSGAGARGPMDGKRLVLLGAALTEQMDESAMEGIMDIVRSAGQCDGADEEELELDLDTMPPDVLWQLDDYAKEVTGGLYNPDAGAGMGAAPRVHRGPQVEGESDEDSDDE